MRYDMTARRPHRHHLARQLPLAALAVLLVAIAPSPASAAAPAITVTASPATAAEDPNMDIGFTVRDTTSVAVDPAYFLLWCMHLVEGGVSVSALGCGDIVFAAADGWMALFSPNAGFLIEERGRVVVGCSYDVVAAVYDINPFAGPFVNPGSR
jgi:hypothetical protein